MHPEYEKRVAEQNRLLFEMLELDRDAEDFDVQFDRVADELVKVTDDLECLKRSLPEIRRALAL